MTARTPDEAIEAMSKCDYWNGRKSLTEQSSPMTAVAWLVDGPLPTDSSEVFLTHDRAVEAFRDWGKRITPLFAAPAVAEIVRPPCPRCSFPYEPGAAERYWEARWRDADAELQRLSAVTASTHDSEIVRLIDVLRADEGDSVMICCDNPDFNGQPNCAIICNGDWTGWVDRRFAADTLLDTLSMAMTEKMLPTPRKVIAESNGHHWIERFNLVYCRDCGFVRRADDQNQPCKGVVSVGPRRPVGGTREP